MLIKTAQQEYKSLGMNEIPNMVKDLLTVLQKYNKNPIKQTEINEFYKLARNQLLSDITGEDDEWEFVTFGKKQFWSNKRRPSIIKTINAIVDFEGVKFILPDARIVTSKISERVIHSFPYKPYPNLVAIENNTLDEQLFECFMQVEEDYEYYKQEIIIDNIIKLCQSGK